MDSEVKDFMRVERHYGTLDADVGGRIDPIYQETSRKENEETVTGLVFTLEGMRQVNSRNGQPMKVQKPHDPKRCGPGHSPDFLMKQQKE